MNLNEYESKSDRPLLIANCFTIELFTMCPVLVRGTHFHKDCHRRGVLFWSEALILGKHYIVQMSCDNGHLILLSALFEDMLCSHRAVVRSGFFQNKIR